VSGTRPMLDHDARLSVVDRRMLLKLLGMASAGPAVATASAGAARAAAAAASLEAFRRLPKILWVWRTGLEELPGVAAFMVRWGFSAALYSLPPGDRARIGRDPGIARNAFAELRRQGPALLLVAGDPHWAVAGAARQAWLPPPLVELFELASLAGPVDGLALDIEPHALPEWKTAERATLARGFVALLRNARLGCEQRGLPLWAALHPSHAATADPERRWANLATAALEYLDAAIAMAYRNDAGRALALAQGLAAAFAARRLPWYMGVTTQEGPEAQHISYHGFASDRFAVAMVDLQRAAASGEAAPTYRGIAVNEFTTLSRLLPETGG
jgi:hypothetical protein